ncbi:hypothetical protein NHQ30_007015 [Ciborinia camelliae]|nr:hypothetical protein NHQ30_007015 [Ciborinia camelliae]
MSISSQSGTPRRVQFESNVTNSPCKNIEVAQRSAGKQYYHRMVEIETRVWDEAKNKSQMNEGESDAQSRDMQRRVKFANNLASLPEKDAKAAVNSINKKYYHRMVDLETKLWIEAKKKPHVDVEDSDGDQLTPPIYQRCRDGTITNDTDSAGTTNSLGIMFDTENGRSELLQSSTKVDENRGMAKSKIGDGSFA